MRTLIALAVIGLILSIAVQVSACIGVDPKTWFPLFWFLHILLFVVWFPAVLINNELPHRQSHGRRVDRVFANLPIWMARSSTLLFLGAVLNFLTLLSITHGGSVEERGGHLLLVSHNHVVKQLTPAEARNIPLYDARLFSGYWIAFYWLGICVLYSIIWHPGGALSQNAPRLHPRMVGSASRVLR